MERQEAKRIVESLLYMTDHALTAREIIEVFDIKEFSQDDVKAFIQEISDEYGAKGSGLQVVEVAGGYQMATRPEMGVWIRRLYKERLTVKLSPSALETLAIIAYKQPIARAEIEQLRGVEASSVVETLLERRLVKIVGRKETIGRPLLYGTSIEFLRQFGLRHLTELPTLESLLPQDKETQTPMEQQELVQVASAPEISEPAPPTEEVPE